LKNVISVLGPSCPQSPQESSIGPRRARTRPRRPSRAIDILTIGDDPPLTACLSRLFRGSEWSIANARTCQGAVSILEHTPAAIALFDQRLPDATWHEAAAALGGVPDAPVLVVVSNDPLLVDEVISMGGFDVLLRPLEEADVMWTIACAWHAWKTRLERNGGMP
jgi:DNA-binding NtrC family response regulator